MLESALKEQLKQYLTAYLRTPYIIEASLDNSKKSEDLKKLLEEIVLLTDKITLKLDGQDQRKPSFSMYTDEMSKRIQFAGIPLGHEYESLLLALLQVGEHPPKIDDSLRDAIMSIKDSLHFETYFSLSCHNCPDVVQALNIMAVLNPNIRHIAIDGGLFQEEVTARDVMSVPTVFLNGVQFAAGRMSIADIVAKLDTGASALIAKQMSEHEPVDSLVIGAGPAASSASIYLARKGLKVIMAADRIGGQIMDTVGIENYVSMVETEGSKLAAAIEAHVRSYPIEIISGVRANNIIPAKNSGDLHQVIFESGAVLKARSIILATGAKWREMGVKGEEEYKTKGVYFCPHCDGPLFKDKKIAVIGGGNSGIEAAIDLAGIASNVTVLEFADTLRADQTLQTKANSLSSVDIVMQAQVLEVNGNGSRVTGITYKDRNTGDTKLLDLEGIFVQIGLSPNTSWLKDIVNINEKGEIVIDAKCRTNVPGIFAAGDCTSVPYKQIIIATGEGAKAALSAFDYLVMSS